MSKIMSMAKNLRIDTGSKSRWDRAIADSETLIQEYEGQIGLLKASIRSFKPLRERGTHFPRDF